MIFPSITPPTHHSHLLLWPLFLFLLSHSVSQPFTGFLLLTVITITLFGINKFYETSQTYTAITSYFQHCHFNTRNTLRYYCHNNIACFITFSNYTKIFLKSPRHFKSVCLINGIQMSNWIMRTALDNLSFYNFISFSLKYFLWCLGLLTLYSNFLHCLNILNSTNIQAKLMSDIKWHVFLKWCMY